MLGQLLSRFREPPEQTFWKWFAAHAEEYRRFEINGPDQQRLFNELNRALNRVCRGIQFEFGVPGENEDSELVVSADGIRDRIPAVQSLVAAAPALPGWKFTAFRQRKPLGEIQLQGPGGTFGAEQLWYRLRPAQGRLDVEVYVSGMTDAPQDVLNFVGFMMLDCALGELDVMTKVGAVSFQAAAAGSPAGDLQRFDTLPEEFDAHYRLMHGG